MKKVCLIMAGGKEMRFGPIKEYLGSKTQMQIEGQEGIIFETIKRNAEIFKKENTYLITNAKQEAAYEAIIKRKDKKFENEYYLSDANIIFEPEPKGTSFCILLSALRFKSLIRNEKIILCIFPSDAYIPNNHKNIRSYNKAIKAAIRVASQSNKMVTIGMKVSYPATAYGYINFEMVDNYYKVIDFEEKPEEDKALEFYSKKGNYFWNSGIFVADLDYLLKLYEEFCPKSIFESFQQAAFKTTMNHDLTWNKAYDMILEDEKTNEKRNIDKMILEPMERNNLHVIPGIFEWQDIGKWDALVMINKINNTIINSVEIIGVDINNKLVYTNGNYSFKSYIADDDKSLYHFIWLYCNPEKNKEEIMKIIMRHDDYKHLDFMPYDLEELLVTKN